MIYRHERVYDKAQVLMLYKLVQTNRHCFIHNIAVVSYFDFDSESFPVHALTNGVRLCPNSNYLFIVALYPLIFQFFGHEFLTKV